MRESGLLGKRNGRPTRERPFLFCSRLAGRKTPRRSHDDPHDPRQNQQRPRDDDKNLGGVGGSFCSCHVATGDALTDLVGIHDAEDARDERDATAGTHDRADDG